MNLNIFQNNLNEVFCNVLYKLHLKQKQIYLNLKKILINKKIINIKKIKINSSNKDFEQWDSLGHLNILLNLDKILKGKALKIENISEAYSVKEIIKILKKNKLPFKEIKKKFVSDKIEGTILSKEKIINYIPITSYH